jgi:hypothetical protein
LVVRRERKSSDTCYLYILKSGISEYVIRGEDGEDDEEGTFDKNGVE